MPSFTLPKDGAYRVHLGDTVRSGGSEYTYRIRLSTAQPDFELRVSPSSATIREKANASVTVHVARRDGYAGPVTVALKGPPPGLVCAPVTIAPGKTSAKLAIKTEPAALEIVRVSGISSAPQP